MTAAGLVVLWVVCVIIMWWLTLKVSTDAAQSAGWSSGRMQPPCAPPAAGEILVYITLRSSDHAPGDASNV